MTPLAAAVLAAGELICEFSDGYRKSLLADLAGDPPRTELVLVYEALAPGAAEVLSTRTPGRRAVEVRATENYVHFIQDDGPSVRVTTLTGCLREKSPGDPETCTRFSARHAWHFDTSARIAPDASYAKQPAGAATGTCEPWKID
ncbi:MAG TPA: hypothetical protein VHL85_04715 [Burkholderiales bacterium]|jgi:hypothetical protein|nr:hypothetical protein [Burkholderiales bacterium]